jgi:hypothetical protein
LSEYKKRIVAFSAVAVILGISISVGIAYLPLGSANQSRTSQVTMTSTATVVSSIISTVTTGAGSTNQVSTIMTGTTIYATTIVVSSSSTAVSGTVSSTTGANSTVITTITTTGESCIVSGYPYGIFLQILTDSGAPVAGSTISGQAVYGVNNQMCTNAVSAKTNSTGWAYLGSNPGNYYVTFSYSETSYNLTIPSRPVTETIATYYVPSGNLTNEYCTYGNPQMCSS